MPGNFINYNTQAELLAERLNEDYPLTTKGILQLIYTYFDPLIEDAMRSKFDLEKKIDYLHNLKEQDELDRTIHDILEDQDENLYSY